MRRSLFVFVSCFHLLGCGTTAEPATDAGTAADAGRADTGGADAGTAGDAGLPARCASDAPCDDGAFCNGREQCMPTVATADSRGCVAAAAAACLASQMCNEATDRCLTMCDLTGDADADGVPSTDCGGTDCDDADADRYPGNTEVCDARGHDEDCNASTIGARDLDDDGAIDAVCCNTQADGSTRCGSDCSDLTASIAPDAQELCNGLDDDCDGMVDEGTTPFLVYPDLDFDLRGDRTATATPSCTLRAGQALVGDDCDDSNPLRGPTVPEICDGVDNDCDGMVDDSTVAVTWYPDADDDGFGVADPARTRVSCTVLLGYSLRTTDCDDSKRQVSPAAAEQCNGRDDDCNGVADFVLGRNDSEDDDADGFADVGCPRVDMPDCDDRDFSTYPGAPELCDLRDNDCSSRIDDGMAMGMWYADADHDGYGTGTAVQSCTPVVDRVTRAGDCDDARADVRPSRSDPCNGIDDDCDCGGVLAGCLTIDEGAARAVFYPDGDADRFGAGAATLACVAPMGTTALPGDCNDGVAAVNPLAPELCNTRDDDCDGVTDDGLVAGACFVDADADGYAATGAASTMACVDVMGCGANRTPRAPAMGMADCADADATRNPGQAELCNLRDDDCDGMVDEGAGTTCYVDADRDGLAPTNAVPSYVCSMGGPGTCPVGRTPTAPAGMAFDCDDNTPGRSPAAYLPDVDRDNYGDRSATPTYACVAPAGLVSDATDCDDTRTSARPGAPELCNRRDDDCDGTVDDGVCRPIADLTAGSNFTCAALVSGEVMCWGENASNELGDGTTYQRGDARPVLTAADVPLTGVRLVEAGESATCAARTDDSVYCWGSGSRAVIGNDQRTPAPYARRLNGLPPGRVLSLGLGQTTACAVIDEAPTDGLGTLWCWGENVAGVYSTPLTGTLTTPTQAVDVSGAPITDAREVDVTRFGLFFDTSACVIRGAARDRVSCVGNNRFGVTGNPMFRDNAYARHQLARLPAGTTGLEELHVGLGHVCVRPAAGAPLCWGMCDSGQCGGGIFEPARFDVIALDAVGTTTSLDVDASSSCFVRMSGEVVCTGSRQSGRLGSGSSAGQTATPEPVVTRALPSPPLAGAVPVAKGFQHACALLTDGRVVCWGTNAGCALGVPTCGGVLDVALLEEPVRNL